MALSDFVNVVITTQSGAVTQAGFGVPLIFDFHTRWTNELVREYSSVAGMAADGFVSSDAAYKAASAAFSQGLSKVKIGRRTTGGTHTVRLTPTAQNSAVYSLKVTSPAGVVETASYTSDGTATVAEISLGLTTAINALTALVTATDAGTHVTLAADSPNTFFGYRDLTSNLKFEDLTTSSNIGTQLDAIALEDPEFYGVVSTSKGFTEIQAIAAWTEANEKLFAYATQDTDAKGAAITDIFSTLKTSGYVRSAGWYSASTLEHMDAAVMGKLLPTNPGSENWKFKSLGGISTAALTASELANIKNKNGNYYISQSGRSITGDGVTAAPEFIDVVRFRDWVKARIQEGIFSLFVSRPKVPYTDGGIASVENVIRSVLESGVAVGGITTDPAYTVSVPRAKNVSSATRASRTLIDVAFQFFLAGAINQVNPINGTVSV